MGIAKRRQFRQRHKAYLEKKYGELPSSLYLFLRERHFRRARNHTVVSLINQSKQELDRIYQGASDLGINLNFLYADHYWQGVILLFDNQEDCNLFRLQFSECIYDHFKFNEIHNDVTTRDKLNT